MAAGAQLAEVWYEKGWRSGLVLFHFSLVHRISTSEGGYHGESVVNLDSGACKFGSWATQWGRAAKSGEHGKAGKAQVKQAGRSTGRPWSPDAAPSPFPLGGTLSGSG